MEVLRFSPDIVTPEMLGLPKRTLEFGLRRVEVRIPMGSIDFTDNAITVNEGHDKVAYVELTGSITGLGTLDLAHYCQPIIEHLGYIREVRFSSRELILQVGDDEKNRLHEVNGPTDLKKDSFRDGEGHDRIVRSAFGFSTHMRYSNGSKLIQFTIDNFDPTKMKFKHTMEVHIQICLTTEAARALAMKAKKEAA